MTLDRALCVRAAGVYLPLLLCGALLLWRRPTARRACAALVGTIWCATTLLAVNVVAVRVQWWTFPGGESATSLSVELLAGWSLLWGAVPILSTRRPPLRFGVAIAVAFDLGVMPHLEPVLDLGPAWLAGEALALSAGLLPALLLSRWIANEEHLHARATLLALLSTAVFLGVSPLLVLSAAHRPLHLALPLDERGIGITLQVLVLSGLISIAAVMEFAARGRGTPLPWDPPHRLITGGPYMYVRNPMQVGMVLAMSLEALLLGEPLLLCAPLAAASFCIAIAAWHENGQLTAAYGDAWHWYTQRVRPWIPRWRPVLSPSSVATLYVSSDCPECTDFGRWMLRRQPRGLSLGSAETLVPLPHRVTYVAADGYRTSGVAAVARALEHCTLGWAMTGWLARLPLVEQAVQALADVSGFGPRVLTPAACAMPETQAVPNEDRTAAGATLTRTA